MRHIPVSTRHWMDVDSTFFECCGRQMDVKTTLCAYWVKRSIMVLWYYGIILSLIGSPIPSFWICALFDIIFTDIIYKIQRLMMIVF